jgi:hypothetical protein
VRIGDAMSCLHAGRTEHCDDRKHRVLFVLPLKPPTSRIQSNKQTKIATEEWIALAKGWWEGRVRWSLDARLSWSMSCSAS